MAVAKFILNGVELKTDSERYVPISGGTLKGKLRHSNPIIVQKDADDGYLQFRSSSNNSNSAVYLFGNDVSESKTTPHGFNAVPGGAVLYAKGTYANKVVIDAKKKYVTINDLGIPYVTGYATDVGSNLNPVYVEDYQIKACTKLYRHDITSSYSGSTQFTFYFYSTDGTELTDGYAIAKALYAAGYKSATMFAVCSGGVASANTSCTPYMGVFAPAVKATGTTLSLYVPNGSTPTVNTIDYTFSDVVTEMR